MNARTLALAAGITALVSGCSTLHSFPDCYGGTRTLLEDPVPLTDVQYPVGLPPRGVSLGTGGLIVANTLWLLDLPLSFALDTALAPFTVWTIPSELSEAERKERRQEGQEAEHEAAVTARAARLRAWEQDPQLAARELGNTDTVVVGQRHHSTGEDAARFLIDLGPGAVALLPDVEAHLLHFVDTPVVDAHELAAQRAAVKDALQVIESWGPEAAPAFPSVHAAFRHELKRHDAHRLDSQLCDALASLGGVSAPATPDLVRLLAEREVYAKRTLVRVIEDLARGGPGAADGLRTVLACDELPEWLQSKAARALEKLD